MNRRSFLCAAPAVALVALPVVAEPQPIPPRDRIKTAIAEIEAAILELYPNFKARSKLHEIRDVDEYDPFCAMVTIIAE